MQGLELIHSCGLVHADIKLDNFRMSIKPNGNQVRNVITDLGSCCTAGSGQQCLHGTGQHNKCTTAKQGQHSDAASASTDITCKCRIASELWRCSCHYAATSVFSLCGATPSFTHEHCTGALQLRGPCCPFRPGWTSFLSSALVYV